MTYMGIWLGNRTANFHIGFLVEEKNQTGRRERERGREGLNWGQCFVSLGDTGTRVWPAYWGSQFCGTHMVASKVFKILYWHRHHQHHLNSIFAIASFSIWYCRRSCPPLWAENILWQKVVFSVFRVYIDEVSLEHNVEDWQQPLHTHMSICLCVFLCSPVWSPTPSIDAFIHSRFLGFLFLRLNLC